MRNFQVKSILFSLFMMLTVAVLVTSCERESFIVEEELQGFKTQSLTAESAETNIDVEFSKENRNNGCSEKCDGFLCLEPPVGFDETECICTQIQLSDIDDNDTISTLDVTAYQRLIIDFDMDCDQDFDAEDWNYILECINAGSPPSASWDHDGDGDIDLDDVFIAPIIAFTAANIYEPGQNAALSCEDLMCIRFDILNRICEEENCTISLGCQGQIKGSGTGWENLNDCTIESKPGERILLRPTVPGPYNSYTYEWSASDGGWGYSLANSGRPYRYTARAVGTYTVLVCENEAVGGNPDCCEEITFTVNAAVCPDCDLDWEATNHSDDGDSCRNTMVRVNGLSGDCTNCEISNYTVVLYDDSFTDGKIEVGSWMTNQDGTIEFVNRLDYPFTYGLDDSSEGTTQQLGSGEYIDFDIFTSGGGVDVELCIEGEMECNGQTSDFRYCKLVEVFCS